jgi:hypothetical protein
MHCTQYITHLLLLPALLPHLLLPLQLLQPLLRGCQVCCKLLRPVFSDAQLGLQCRNGLGGSLFGLLPHVCVDN